MRIASLDATSFHSFPHQAAAGEGTTATYPISLFRGTVTGLPAGVDALVVASDLQGIAPVAARGGAVGLVGEALADHLADLAELGEIPPLARVGVVLAGDLFSAPAADRRGASGDVRSVWRSFARHAWVAGVAGNHDTFGKTFAEQAQFAAEPRMALLDGARRDLDGLVVAGVGGIIGNPNKPQRHKENQFLRTIETLLAGDPVLLVLHQGPDDAVGRQRGHEAVRRVLQGHRRELLVVCGHTHWREPIVELSETVQVVNVDGRVLVLGRT
jgi:Icc-related predicted phosphoesterase